jgi:hypothetical protein
MHKPKKQAVNATVDVAISEQIKAFASILISIYLENEAKHEKCNTKEKPTDGKLDG